MITILLIVMDILWVMTMRQVWASKPSNNKTTWTVFNHLRTFTLVFSYINILIKGAIVVTLIKLQSRYK